MGFFESKDQKEQKTMDKILNKISKKEQEILSYIYLSIFPPTFSELLEEFDDRIVKTLFKKKWLIHNLRRNGIGYVLLTGEGTKNLQEKEVK